MNRAELVGLVGPLDDLSAEECDKLAELLTAALAYEAKALDEAIDVTLAELPYLLRKPAKKVMFG